MKNMKRKNDVFDLTPGTILTGKWHRKKYMVRRKLGAGAVGAVYLCIYQGKKVALKVSKQNTSVMAEVNVLKSLRKVQGMRLGPSLLDVDDWITREGNLYSFYVMEYLRGIALDLFIRRHGEEWIGVFMLQLLHRLEGFHEAGWVFGDLKMDNILITSNPPKIRMVDVGGTTKFGRSIKEFTEFYDRGYWKLGTREADPGYDLFALAMVFIEIYYTKHFPRTNNPTMYLFQKIDQVPALTPYRKILKKAIAGKYQTSTEMRRDVVHYLHSRKRRRHVQNRRKRVARVPIMIEASGILLIACGYYGLSYFLFG